MLIGTVSFGAVTVPDDHPEGVPKPFALQIDAVDADRIIVSSAATVAPSTFGTNRSLPPRWSLTDAKVTIPQGSNRFQLEFNLTMSGSGAYVAAVSYSALVCTVRP
jgi:hypothetical protein